MLKSARTLLKGLLFALLCANLSAHAEDDCEVRLTPSVHALRMILSDGMIKGVISGPEILRFAKSETWYNPFTRSSRHLLTPRFVGAFAGHEALIGANERALLKTQLIADLEARKRQAQTAVEASAATEAILNPRELEPISFAPLLLVPGEPLTAGTVEGRPVFMMDAVGPGGKHLSVIFDPLNTAPDARMKRLAPQVAQKRYPTFEADGRRYNFPGQVRMRRDVADTALDFFNSKGEFISKFTLPRGQYIPEMNTYTKIFTREGRQMALVPYHGRSKTNPGAYLVDIGTGKSVGHVKVAQVGDQMGVTERGGELYVYYPDHVYMENTKILFVRVRDEQSFSIKTGSGEYSAISEFAFNGAHYLVWAEPGALAFADADTGAIFRLATPVAPYFWHVQPFEHDGQIYVMMSGRQFRLFRLTNSSRSFGTPGATP